LLNNQTASNYWFLLFYLATNFVCELHSKNHHFY
jgi:hypothetical protein